VVDLATIKPNDRIIEITNPGTGENLGVRVTVMSYDDDRLKKTRRQLTDKRFADDQKRKPLRSEQVEENGNILLFSAMTGWEWYNPTGDEGDADYDADATPEFAGDPNPAFNRRNVFTVFDALPWFRAQVDTAVADEEAFFINSKSV